MLMTKIHCSQHTSKHSTYRDFDVDPGPGLIHIYATPVICPNNPSKGQFMPPAAEILSKKIICKQLGRYIGWPTIVRTRAGDLIIVFSGDRDSHICPWGKTQMVRSSDEGKTWSDPVVIRNTPFDDRDAGLVETAAGTLIATWFTSMEFESNPKY